MITRRFVFIQIYTLPFNREMVSVLSCAFLLFFQYFIYQLQPFLYKGEFYLDCLSTLSLVITILSYTSYSQLLYAAVTLGPQIVEFKSLIFTFYMTLFTLLVFTIISSAMLVYVTCIRGRIKRKQNQKEGFSVDNN